MSLPKQVFVAAVCLGLPTANIAYAGGSGGTTPTRSYTAVGTLKFSELSSEDCLWTSCTPADAEGRAPLADIRFVVVGNPFTSTEYILTEGTTDENGAYGFSFDRSTSSSDPIQIEVRAVLEHSSEGFRLVSPITSFSRGEDLTIAFGVRSIPPDELIRLDLNLDGAQAYYYNRLANLYDDLQCAHANQHDVGNTAVFCSQGLANLCEQPQEPGRRREACSPSYVRFFRNSGSTVVDFVPGTVTTVTFSNQVYGYQQGDDDRFRSTGFEEPGNTATSVRILGDAASMVELYNRPLFDVNTDLQDVSDVLKYTNSYFGHSAEAYWAYDNLDMYGGLIIPTSDPSLNNNFIYHEGFFNTAQVRHNGLLGTNVAYTVEMDTIRDVFGFNYFWRDLFAERHANPDLAYVDAQIATPPITITGDAAMRNFSNPIAARLYDLGQCSLSMPKEQFISDAKATFEARIGQVSHDGVDDHLYEPMNDFVVDDVGHFQMMPVLTGDGHDRLYVQISMRTHKSTQTVVHNVDGTIRALLKIVTSADQIVDLQLLQWSTYAQADILFSPNVDDELNEGLVAFVSQGGLVEALAPALQQYALSAVAYPSMRVRRPVITSNSIELIFADSTTDSQYNQALLSGLCGTSLDGVSAVQTGNWYPQYPPGL